MNILTAHKITTVTKKDEIDLILQKGKKFKFQFGLIFLYHLRQSTERKAGILIKKSIGNAVKRNRVKRLVRSYFRNHYQIFESYNRIIVLINKKADISYQQLEKQLTVVLSKNEKAFTLFN